MAWRKTWTSFLTKNGFRQELTLFCRKYPYLPLIFPTLSSRTWRLERPCLSHISSPQPSGHAVSMQGTLLQLAPPTLDSDSRWQVSAEVFQKLFEMADKLDLNGYITPVQAWNRIRDHENFPRLTRETLKTLQNAMRPHIKCQG
jgi:hypothetical protein